MNTRFDKADLIIKPKKNLLDLNISEIWKYRDLILLMVKRDFVSQIKQTLLGPLWYIITPLLSVMIFTVVFTRIAHISTEGFPPILFYLSGLTLWGYFSSTFSATSNTFIANAGIFGKVYFPRLVSPISVVISSMIRFLIQFSLLLIIILYYYLTGYSFNFSEYTLLIPFLIIITAILALGAGIIISSLTTRYRDLTNVLPLAIQLWMYITPIIYPVSIIPKSYQWIVQINPITPLIEAFKYGLIGAGSVDFYSLIYSVIFSFALFFIGIIMFNKVEGTFMDTI